MDEMVNMLSATRSYEANLQAVNSAKDMQQKTLEILR
jgi:flagellar basal body rod protein FlgC